MKTLTHLNSYKALQNHFLDIKDVHMRTLFSEDLNRGFKYFLQSGDLKLDYSKNRINDETLKLLFDLAKECSLKEKIDAMFEGEKINSTENRAVLHTALRNKSDYAVKIDDMDIEKMYPNCITSTVLASARIPCVVANDREAIQICIRTCNKIEQEKVRVVRIPNSLHIGEIMLSESYYEDVKAGKYPGVEALDEPAKLEFDENGNLITKIK